MKGIYKIVNKINGKIYVGQAKNINKRWNSHIRELDRNIHYNEYLQRSWNKYGKENFEFVIIEETENLDDKEKFWISHFKSIKAEFGYNQTAGGAFGELSLEARQKISKALSGENHHMYGRELPKETKKKLSEALSGEKNPFYGKKHSQETRNKISTANKGRKTWMYGKKHSDETRKKISEVTDNNGEKNPMYGKKHSDETKRKISEANKGKIHPKKYQFTNEQINDMIEKRNSGMLYKEISLLYNCPSKQISHILRATGKDILKKGYHKKT